jgi:hypothetical protein
MAKPLQQNDDGTVSDPVTTETQKGYANYEADLKKRQEEMTGKDAKTKSKMESLMKFGSDLLSRPVEKKAKGGKVKSASARADGCAIRGKTRA